LGEIFVEAEATVYPTEDIGKVEKAIRNVVGGAFVEKIEGQNGAVLLRAKAVGKEALLNFQNLLRQDRIRNAARAILLAGSSSSSILLYLNKQVAFVSHISFSKPSAESPLGPIKVKITCDNPASLIDWLAPSTSALRGRT